jgi:hypothetical protein
MNKFRELLERLRALGVPASTGNLAAPSLFRGDSGGPSHIWLVIGLKFRGKLNRQEFFTPISLRMNPGALRST